MSIIHSHGIVRIFHLKIHEKYIQQQKHIGKDHIVVGNTYSQTITTEIACRNKFITYIEQNLYVFFPLTITLIFCLYIIDNYNFL